MTACREFEYSDRDFTLLQELVFKHSGIFLPAHKQDLVYGRLSRRLRALHIENFHGYCDLINNGDATEIEHFVNAITTNLTSFFREEHHFENLGGELLPELISRKSGARRLRIWSAGCSTGEEPYSIAITLRENMTVIDDWDVKILATDLDSNVIAKAMGGIYQERLVADMAQQRLKKWFHRGTGNQQHMVRVVPDIRKLISFRQLNLIDEWPMHGAFDVIFCRNVIIYFDKPTQVALFDRFANMMPVGGRLYVGHSENLRHLSSRFKLLGNTIYEKTG